MHRLACIATILALVTVSCGDDSSSDSDQVVSGLRTQLSASNTGDQFDISDEEAECSALRLVADLGPDRMAEALTMDFEEFMASASRTERRTVVDAMLDCVDLRDGLTTELAGDISRQSAGCVADAMLASNAFRDALAEAFAGGDSVFEDDALVAAMLPAMLECLSPEELLELGS